MSTDKIKDAINKYKSVEQEQIKQPTSYDIPKQTQNTYQPEMYKETDPDLIVGYEVVKLPSKGVNKYAGVGFDEFKIEYLTSQDEDVLTTPSLIENGTVLDVLLRRKIKENINVDELFYGDKNAITLFLRTSSYGFNYDVEAYDPRTGSPFKTTVDLSKLKFKKVTELPDEHGLYNVELEIRKKLVRFKLLTSGEERNILKKADAIKEAYNEEISQFNSLKFKAHIVSIDGNESRDYINKFIDALPLKDAYLIKKKIHDVTPDLDMTYEFTTPDGYKFKSNLSIGVDFFFPSI